PVPPLPQARDHGRLLLGREGTVIEDRRHAVAGERVHLIFHQRNERRDDHRQAVAHERRRLKAERLASAGRQDDDRIASGEDGVHRLVLQRPERGVAPVTPQHRLKQIAHARPENSRVSVWTRTLSPSLMKSGTRISSPVDSVAALVAAPLAVSPRTPGSVDVTTSSTCGGNCRPMGLPLYFCTCTITLSTSRSLSSPTLSAASMTVSNVS